MNRRSYKKENNPNFKGGKPKCQNCGEILSSYVAKLCRQCYVEEKTKNIMRDVLIDLYVNKELSMSKIAIKFNCSASLICYKMKEYGIKARSKTENYEGKGNPNYKGIIHRCIDCNKEINPYSDTIRCWDCFAKYNTGENHYNWNNWSSREEYGAKFDSALKEKVRFRDHYKCQVCGCSQLENGRQLDCHHIDYDKKHNELNNLIALCMGCHTKTNSNRKYWEQYFQNKLKQLGVLT